MYEIPYDSLSIAGLDYLHIMEVEINQKISEHGRAMVRVEVEASVGEAYYNRATENECIGIMCNGFPLFYGLITNLTLEHRQAALVMTLELVSTSIRLDTVVESHSYQRSAYDYSEVMSKAAEKYGSVVFYANDEKIPGFVIQYKETAWNFIKRMATGFNSFVFADIVSMNPQATVGICTYPSSIDYFVFAGTRMNNKVVTEVTSVLVRGFLHTEFRTMAEDQVAVYSASNTGQGLFGGKVFQGVVKAVQRDMIQAHIIDIDSGYDVGGDWWFPYSTIYSTEMNGGTYYSMPQVDDPVRIFFPSEQAEDSFAASSVNVRGGRNDYQEKCFQTPDEMEVLFTAEGLMLSCRDKKVYIQLLKDGGVVLNSDTTINILSNENVNLVAANHIQISSDEYVYLGTKSSFIKLSNVDGGRTDIYSKQIFVK